MACLEWYLDPPIPHQLKKKNKLDKVGPPLTKFSGSAHAFVEEFQKTKAVVPDQAVRTTLFAHCRHFLFGLFSGLRIRRY